MSFQAVAAKLLTLVSASLRMELSGETVVWEWGIEEWD